MGKGGAALTSAGSLANHEVGLNDRASGLNDPGKFSHERRKRQTGAAAQEWVTQGGKDRRTGWGRSTRRRTGRRHPQAEGPHRKENANSD